jgi:hypothetical protein
VAGNSVAINSAGLGYLIDLGGFDRVAGIQSTPAVADIYNDRGSLWHTALGAVTGFMPGAWPVLATSLFAGYQLSKVEGGKPFPRIAGAMIEFAAGMALAGLYLLAKGR